VGGRLAIRADVVVNSIDEVLVGIELEALP
jgi:hypothetical protein